MIPQEIDELVHQSAVGRPERDNLLAAQDAMQKLGIPPSTEFYEFCSKYCLGSLTSAKGEQLVDVSEPSNEIEIGTRFVREVWGLQDDLVCFTTCQGEGGYMYSLSNGAVYDFSLGDQFSPQLATWGSFYSFLTWYLSPSTPGEP